MVVKLCAAPPWVKESLSGGCGGEIGARAASRLRSYPLMRCEYMYVQRRKGKRNSVWVYGVWTAVVEDGDGSLWHDYEVRGSDEAAFMKLYERTPDARLYRRDGYNANGWVAVR